MINGYPTEEELRDRILRHLGWRHRSEATALLWQGYLAGLMEWGLIDVQIFERLSDLLPLLGRKELSELFSDEPLTPAMEAEIDGFLKSRG